MLRIVSLIASATEIVHALGLGIFQVGRSHECDFPESVLHLPICTRPRIDVCVDSAAIDHQVKNALARDGLIYDVFPDVLADLRPTHILTQVQCKVCAVSLEDVERALSGDIRPKPALIALEPNSLADVFGDICRVASSCGVPDRGEVLVKDLKSRMEPFRGSTRPRVACVEWLEPLMAAGNWIPELIELAGGQNLFGTAGKHSPWLAWDHVLAANPDVLIAMPCGFNLERTCREMDFLTSRPGWRTLRSRVYIVDANAYFTRPGPRLADSVQMLVEMLHSEKAEGVGWRRF